MKKIIEHFELEREFSSSLYDGSNYETALEMIEKCNEAKPDGNMLNLNTLPILLANVLDVYNKNVIKLYKVWKDERKIEYIIKIAIEY